MQDKEWTVTRVSDEPAREWNNPKGGVIYYRKVMLDGHPRPVSVGKKDPNALHVGSTIYGRVMADMSGSEDKFKAGQNPNFGGGQQAGFGGGSTTPKPAYKDNSDGMRQGMCFNNAANYVNQFSSQGKGDTSLTATQWADTVYEFANALYLKGDLGGTSDTLKATPNPTTSQMSHKREEWDTHSTASKTASNPARLKQGDPVWPSDREDAEAASLYQSVAEAEFGGEDTPLDQIPF